MITDHAAYTLLLSQRNPLLKLAWWAMRIQELDLKTYHRLGKSNLVADALSRHPLPVADVLQVVADARVEDAPTVLQCKTPPSHLRFTCCMDDIRKYRQIQYCTRLILMIMLKSLLQIFQMHGS